MATFKTDDVLNHILDTCIDLCKYMQIPISRSINPLIQLVPMRSKFADCCGPRCPQNKSGYSFQIRFSSIFFENGKESEFIETMLHELLHTCNGCMNHGPLWRSYAAKLNKQYGLNIKRCGNHLEAAAAMDAAKPKVVKIIKLRCTGCGIVWTRYRESSFTLHPNHYTCGKCHSKIERI